MVRAAAHCGFWIGLTLIFRGDHVLLIAAGVMFYACSPWCPR